MRRHQLVARSLCILLSLVQVHCMCIEESFKESAATVCIEECTELKLQGCVDSNFVDDVVEICLHTPVRKFRRGLFSDLRELTNIKATNIALETIYPGAFLNLPKIRSLNLSYNYIEDVVLDVFNGLGAVAIDLSFNTLSYVDQGAFSHMPNLKILLLNNNNLNHFNKRWIGDAFDLEVLDLSHNQIARIWSWGFDMFPSLKVLDISHNGLVKIGVGAFKTIDLVDLSHNQLTEIVPDIFQAETAVNLLDLSSNNLTSLDERLFTKRKFSAVSLHPNPWRCPHLKKIMKWSAEHRITVLNTVTKRSYAICFCGEDSDPLECVFI